MAEGFHDDIEQRIEEAEAKGVQGIKRLGIKGSFVVETLEQARETLKEFKRVFGLE